MWRNKRNGTSLIEFTLVGIPAIFLTLSIFEVSMAMWQYHTLAEAAQLSARYVIAHGYTCTQNGNTCSITLGNLASYIEAAAVGLDKSKLDVNVIAVSGTTSCAPISTCEGNGSTYPSGSTDGAVGADITVSATYPVLNPIAIYWPGTASVSTSGTLTLSAKSRQRISF